MTVTVAVRWSPKAGNSPEEYEDAWCMMPLTAAKQTGEDRSPLRLTVGDGATESLLAGRWVRLLTETFASAPGPALLDPHWFAAMTGAAAARWPSELDAYLSDRVARKKPLQWYEQPGMARGASATLLAVQVEGDPPQQPAQRYKWYAAAVGDTCLFQVRDDRIAAAFPLNDPRAFSNTPDMLNSRATPTEITPLVRLAAGCVLPGDQLFLCTDALAQWFLQAAADGQRPWKTLHRLDKSSFLSWLATARADEGLRNDDVTLVQVRFED